MTHFSINVRPKRQALNKHVGSISCRYKLFDISITLVNLNHLGVPVVFGRLKGVLGTFTVESRGTRGKAGGGVSQLCQ